MRTKRRIGIILLFVATFTLLAHEVVPHCHAHNAVSIHQNASVSGGGEQQPYLCSADHHHSHHECGIITIALQAEHRLIDIPAVDLFVTINQSILPEIPVQEITPYSSFVPQDNQYLIFIFKESPLRAPPAVVA